MAPEETPSGAAGAVQQVQEKGREAVSGVQEQVQPMARQLRGEASERLRSEVDRRSTQAGEQAQSIASAVRTTAGQLREEGKQPHAKVAEQAADRVESFGRYLRDANADRILHDLEGFTRRRPWLVGAGSVVLGCLGSRFLKASSGRRYEVWHAEGSTGRTQREGAYASLPPLPAAGTQIGELPERVEAGARADS